MSIQKSTTVRLKTRAALAFIRYAERVAPRRAGRMARDLWFTAPPRMAELPVPDHGEVFTVQSQGASIRGQVWGNGPVVYLVHGWGGRGSQFAALVQPLLRSGHRVVMFDAPAHGGSGHGPSGPRRTNGVEFARALDDVFARFGPAEAVVAHSLGTISTYLALRFGWLGTERLVLIAPMVESQTLFDGYQSQVGFGPRTRRAFDRSVLEWIGIPVAEFDARVQAEHVDPVPTLVVADRDDRQTPYADAVDLAESTGADLMTTRGLGHRKVLRDPQVVQRVVAFIARDQPLTESA